MTSPIRVFLDRNDAAWTSQRYYVDSLAACFARDPRVRLVDRIDDADVAHVNYLNPLGRIIHGKENRRRHLRDLAAVVRNTAIPVVATEHGVEEFSNVEASMFLNATSTVQRFVDAAKRRIERSFARQLDAVIAISSMEARYLVEAGFDPTAVHHVPHGVDSTFLSDAGGDDGDYVLHVSKCSPHKNPRAILAVARRLDVEMKVVGLDWQQRYGDELAALDNVTVVGHVTDDELAALYSGAQVFYLPSTYEPFGLPILEAMACETPVVASRHSAAPDICEESIALVDPHDHDQHVAALTRLLEDDDLRRARGQAARRRAREFTWDRTAASTIEIYETLLSE